MASEVLDIEVRLPDRAQRARSSGPRAHKPMAEVALHVSQTDIRRIVVPVRVGRQLMGLDLALPRDVDAVFDEMHALEARICFAELTDMISRREHAEAEARGKLERYGYRQEDIDAAVERAKGLHFLDDDRFVSGFVESALHRGWGRRKVEAELRQRGVDPARYSRELDVWFCEEDDVQRAQALLERRAVPDARAYDKLVRYLVSKGFSYRIADEAARDRLASNDAPEPRAR